MPMLTAQKHQWTKQPPYNFYHFPEEHLTGWTTFWKEMDGDMDKILEFAKTSGVEFPNEWFESLHRFLFGVFSGDAKLLKTAASASFQKYVGQAAKNHQKEPKEKTWYTVRGITQSNFIAMLERAAEISDPRQAVAFINARVKDLGFNLYSEFLLAKTQRKSEIKSVASDMNKKAYALECTALGESPIGGIEEGTSVTHSLFPESRFMVIDVEEKDGSLNSVVARDSDGRVAFINDVWNIQVL